MSEQQVDKVIGVLVDAITSALGPDDAQQQQQQAGPAPGSPGRPGGGLEAVEGLLHSMLDSAVQRAAAAAPELGGAAAAGAAGYGLLSPRLMLKPQKKFESVSDIQQMPVLGAAAGQQQQGAAADPAEAGKVLIESLVRDALLLELQDQARQGQGQQQQGQGQSQALPGRQPSTALPTAAAAQPAGLAPELMPASDLGASTAQASAGTSAAQAVQPGQALLDLLVETLLADASLSADNMAEASGPTGAPQQGQAQQVPQHASLPMQQLQQQYQQLQQQLHQSRPSTAGQPAALADVTNTGTAPAGTAAGPGQRGARRFSLPGMDKMLDSTDTSDAEHGVRMLKAAFRARQPAFSPSSSSSWEGETFRRNKRLLAEGLRALEEASSKQGRLVSRRQAGSRQPRRRQQRQQQDLSDSSDSSRGKQQATPGKPHRPPQQSPPSKAASSAAASPAGPGLGYHNARYTIVEDRRRFTDARPLPPSIGAQLSPMIDRSGRPGLQQPAPSESPYIPSKPAGRGAAHSRHTEQPHSSKATAQQGHTRPHGPPDLDSYRGSAVKRLWRAGDAQQADGDAGGGQALAHLQDPLLHPRDSSDSSIDASSSSLYSSVTSSSYSTTNTLPGAALRASAADSLLASPAGLQAGPGQDAAGVRRAVVGAGAGLRMLAEASAQSMRDSTVSRSDMIRSKLQMLAAKRRKAVAEVSGSMHACRSTCYLPIVCKLAGRSLLFISVSKYMHVLPMSVMLLSAIFLLSD